MLVTFCLFAAVARGMKHACAGGLRPVRSGGGKDQGAKSSSSVNVDKIHDTALSPSAGEELRVLIECGFKLDSVDAKERSALHRLAKAGELAAVRVMIAHRADLDLVDYKGLPPLTYAAARGHFDVVRELIEAGAKITSPNFKTTPLEAARIKHHTEIYKYLKEHCGGTLSPVNLQQHDSSCAEEVENFLASSVEDDFFAPTEGHSDEIYVKKTSSPPASRVVPVIEMLRLDDELDQRGAGTASSSEKSLADTEEESDFRREMFRPIRTTTAATERPRSPKVRSYTCRCCNEEMPLKLIYQKQSVVKFTGLKGEEGERLNGEDGMICQYDEASKSCVVMLDTAKNTGKFKLSNLLISTSPVSFQSFCCNSFWHKSCFASYFEDLDSATARHCQACGANFVEALRRKAAAWKVHARDFCTVVCHGRADVVLAMLQLDPSLANELDEEFQTPLSYAVRSDQSPMRSIVTRILLEHGAEVNYSSGACDLPAVHVLSRGVTDILQILIEGKADVNLKDSNGCPMLFYALENPDTTAIDLLVRGKADIEARYQTDTPLHYAAKYSSPQTVDALIRNGANVNALDVVKTTNALSSAIVVGDLEKVKSLLKAKSDPNISAGKAWTPMHYCCVDDSKHPLLRVMLHHGGSVLNDDGQGVRPLDLVDEHFDTTCRYIHRMIVVYYEWKNAGLL